MIKEVTTFDHEGYPVHVKNRMTDDEQRRFREKADRLLSALESKGMDTWEPTDLMAYGHGRRIGVLFKKNRDPLGNGVLTGNVDGFNVEAVNPRNYDEVYIRFWETDDD